MAQCCRPLPLRPLSLSNYTMLSQYSCRLFCRGFSSISSIFPTPTPGSVGSSLNGTINRAAFASSSPLPNLTSSPYPATTPESTTITQHLPIPVFMRDHPLSFQANVYLREEHLAPSLKAHYQNTLAGPLKVAYGRGQYLYDEEGRDYLDCVNNVAHVGHCHPRVVNACHLQMAKLNTNTRYLHDNVVRLAAALSATFPDHLSVVFFVNSGTEANDLALRLARLKTQRSYAYCVDGAYHGHSGATLSVSPYHKYTDMEAPTDSIKLIQPCSYRHHLAATEITKKAYLEYETHLSTGLHAPAAFIVESVQCCGGQVFLPSGYLEGMQTLTHTHGGVCISDEVQTGFGRLGSNYWAFESHPGALPDIVSIGKPFGNGFPLSAIVTTREIADAAKEIEYFNTFGGNPVACAIGLEVLSVIEDEGLQENARVVGQQVMADFASLQTVHQCIGDVRGKGFLMGVELVLDRQARTPDPAAAAYVMQRMKALGVLISVDGPNNNVLKLKPPMCFTAKDGQRLCAMLDIALTELAELKTEVGEFSWSHKSERSGLNGKKSEDHVKKPVRPRR
eukprot:gb/GEZN01005727.1/.p1 GENE.gb/GEZN01005727.1/~~gb/GEZN01005727.1/.p1  ORF type:complete len:564 (+),score=46.20 gb/GEZN01005727.1/:29-1720(+)